jgi:1,4-alpha-glucan branching enzyme
MGIPSEYDLYLFHEGSHLHSYEMLGAHATTQDGVTGVRFAVWAPNARDVRVVGNFNRWQGDSHNMTIICESGIWSIFVPEIEPGEVYKYEIHTQQGNVLLKADPYAFSAEQRPSTASKVVSLADYVWCDGVWQDNKQNHNSFEGPMLIYEVHLGSWKRKEDGAFLSYRELADELVEYVAQMGYTHIELLPITEHPFDGSWGYQSTGYYAVTSRYGTPHDFMYFVDRCHQRGIGVILDWVPGHFCKDDHGLRLFDGTALYEHENLLRSENWQWGTTSFDFSKSEVVSFLISNAFFWLDVYHIDGLRVDAVANMLYLDYGKEEGQWIANRYGGNENLEAVDFLKKLNQLIGQHLLQKPMIAEESTAWPLVTRPPYVGGLGFHYKWNMGWMNDMLRYMAMPPIHRKWHHNLVTFSFMYAFSENFLLALSHDEVVHGKKSLLDKMPGDYWQKFANLRCFYAYMMAHPGKKLLFMGGEFGQFVEWRYQSGLDWNLLGYDMHQKLQNYVRDLNYFYRQENVLWEEDHSWRGFQWIDPHDYSQSVITFLRSGHDPDDIVLVVCNFTPEVRHGYRIGVPKLGAYEEVFNSDWEMYGGSGQQNSQMLKAEALTWHNQPCSLELCIPPLATIYLKPK